MIADAKTKVYGDADPSLTYQVSGLKNGDNGDADPALTYQVSGLKNGDTAGAVLNGGSLSRVAGENDSRPRPWQGRALPTELFPQWRPLGDSNPCYRRERAVSSAADNAGGVIRPTGAGNEYPGSHPPRRANNRNAVIRRFHGAAAAMPIRA